MLSFCQCRSTFSHIHNNGNDSVGYSKPTVTYYRANLFATTISLAHPMIFRSISMCMYETRRRNNRFSIFERLQCYCCFSLVLSAAVIYCMCCVWARILVCNFKLWRNNKQTHSLTAYIIQVSKTNTLFGDSVMAVSTVGQRFSRNKWMRD